MKTFLKFSISLPAVFLSGNFLAGTNANAQQKETASLAFDENKGQWHSNVGYKADISFGCVFLEKDKFFYVYYTSADLEKAHPHENSSPDDLPHDENAIIRCHAIKVSFVNSNPDVIISCTDKTDAYFNYFICSNPENRASSVNAFRQINYSDIYKGIDLNVYSDDFRFKYDFIIKPGMSAAEIRLLMHTMFLSLCVSPNSNSKKFFQWEES